MFIQRNPDQFYLNSDSLVHKTQVEFLAFLSPLSISAETSDPCRNFRSCEFALIRFLARFLSCRLPQPWPQQRICSPARALTILAADDPVEILVRRDRVAKKGLDEEQRRDETDTRGWSSAIPDHSSFLRRRGGSCGAFLYDNNAYIHLMAS
ncbi:uncharacterized protein LOC104583493 [Brachypodium distachyon]|uniref:Uncharacterized protein n=1 Tax=Brachypodium distachyon TaxID=15368 RepID=A0A0Q3I1E5_BRADI|nr:uncharacterized protein LOC104583493 [Brachypodium distachyon]KQJ94299.1 hypothetical protein BRADI_3g09736v3 [Brachypodium distachyon]|eukprot:XP_024316203.1 uncharacterized protein LOC104583493 [Brachypodium distachyon]